MTPWAQWLLMTWTAQASFLAAVVRAQALYSEFPSRSTILAAADDPPLQGSNHTRKHPALSVLGYVTPWNPRGYRLVENYRGKFTSVSPVWYILNTDGDPNLQRYQLHGGPPTDADVYWYHRLASPHVDEKTGQTLPPVKIMPRVMLEQWSADDYRTLLSHTIEGVAFAEAIMAEIITRDYQGVVLESAAAYAMREPIKLLSERMQQEGKELVLVLPPLREDTSEVNELVMTALQELEPLVDKIHVMTYDHVGPSGKLWKADVEIPNTSPLSKDGVRTFGPNSPLSWIARNIEGLTGQSSDAHEGVFAPNGGDSGIDNDGFGLHSSSSYSYVDVQAASAPESGKGVNAALPKLLVGLPCYGYTYAVGWLDKDGKPQVVLPPSSPIASKDNSTEEQAKSRRRAETKEQSQQGKIWPILTKAGDTLTFDALRETLEKSKVLVRRDEQSAENYIDYLKAREDGATQRRPDGTNAPIAWYRRAYFPSASTMKTRLDLVKRMEAGGIALWDVGQGGSWLLHEL